MRGVNLSESPIDPDIHEDLLGFYQEAQKIYPFIVNIDTPFVLGILGEWGAGKTSFLRILRKIIMNREEYSEDTIILTAWIDTLGLSRIDLLIEGLFINSFEQVLSHIEGNEKLHEKYPRFYKELKSKLKKIKEILGKGFSWRSIFKRIGKFMGYGAYFLSPFPFAEVSKETISKILEGFSPTNQLVDLENLRKTVEEISEIMVKHGFKLIIFIDDFDRMLPFQVLELLEMIKVFFDKQGFGVIITFDDKALRDIITKAFVTSFGEVEIDISKYAEKLIPMKINLPKPDPNVFVKRYMRRLLKSLLRDESEELLLEEETLKRVSRIIDYNPRRAKTLVTVYSFIAKTKREDVIKLGSKKALLFYLMVLYHLFPKIYADFETIIQYGEEDKFNEFITDMQSSDKVSERYNLSFQQASRLKELMGEIAKVTYDEVKRFTDIIKGVITPYITEKPSESVKKSILAGDKIIDLIIVSRTFELRCIEINPATEGINIESKTYYRDIFKNFNIVSRKSYIECDVDGKLPIRVDLYINFETRDKNKEAWFVDIIMLEAKRSIGFMRDNKEYYIRRLLKQAKCLSNLAKTKGYTKKVFLIGNFSDDDLRILGDIFITTIRSDKKLESEVKEIIETTRIYIANISAL